MTISEQDMHRLVVEMIGDGEADTEGWLNEAGIEPDAFVSVVNKLQTTLASAVIVGNLSAKEAVQGAIATAFQIGWQAHREFGHAERQ